MSALLWGSWAEEWALYEKVSFNGVTRKITVNEDVPALDIRGDVYSAWVRWHGREENSRFLPAMRYSGADPIPGGETGATFFLMNGWKLVYDANKVAMAGVLYSEDYDTPYWSADDKPLYPATVSALVNTAVTVQNVVTGDLSEVPAAVWAYVARTLTSGMTAEEVADAVARHPKTLTVPKYLGLK